MKNSVRLPAFAKINLCLHILGRRPDGYHELRTIFQAISLRDTLELSLARQPGITLEIDDPSLPTGPENLVYRAIDSICRAMEFRGGVHARLEKIIPVARGLGGGSSDAASAMIAMLRLTKKRIPLDRLIGTRGQKTSPPPDLPHRHIVVVSPARIGVSTKDAYQWVSAQLTKRADAPSI